MNRAGFMSRLEGLLMDVPSLEKDEALQYYNDYFEDAGVENEEAVIRSLGSPESIAENIKAELRGETIPDSAKSGDHAIMKYGQIAKADCDSKTQESVGQKCAEGMEGSGKTQNAGDSGGYGGAGFFGSYGATGDFGGSEKGYNNMETTWTQNKENKKHQITGVWKVILVIVLICALPPIIGCLLSLLGGFLGIVMGWFGIVIASGAVALAMFICAVVLIWVAVLCLPVVPIASLPLFGIGLILGAIGFVSMMLTAFLGGKVTPMLIKGIRFIIRGAICGVETLIRMVTRR